MQRTVAGPRPREPADDLRCPVSGHLAALISADGRAHPSDAVRRYNWAVLDGQDPFLRHYFGVLAAFRLGAVNARRYAERTSSFCSVHTPHGRAMLPPGLLRGYKLRAIRHVP